MYILDDTTETPQEVGFDFRVPDGWSEFDLSGATLADRRAELLSAYADDPQRQEAASAMLDGVTRELKRATDLGLIAAAGTLENYDDGLFMANVCVFSLATSPGQGADLFSIAESIHPKRDQTPGETWLQTVPVDLPETGTAARVFGLAEHRVDEENRVRSIVMHTVIKVPRRDRQLLVSCSSPNTDHPDELLDLFDAITQTVRFWHQDAPATAGR